MTTAVHGPSNVLEPLASQDLRIGDAIGRLVLVDYADLWPLTHLTWLLSNSMFHGTATPTRVLLIASNLDAWPAVRAAVAGLAAATSSQLLTSLPETPSDGLSQRDSVFSATCSAASRVLSIEGPVGALPPGPLDAPACDSH